MLVFVLLLGVCLGVMVTTCLWLYSQYMDATWAYYPGRHADRDVTPDS